MPRIVRYLTTEEAANAVRTLHRSVLDGRSLNVRFYKPLRQPMGDDDVHSHQSTGRLLGTSGAMMHHHQMS